MERVRRPDEFRMPRWNDLPPVPLYLDQVLVLVDEWLGPYLSGHKRKVLTRTMVNNYVKLKFIPAPVNKKYDQVTVASLFVIAVLKSVFSIEETALLIQLALNHSEQNVAYDGFCEYMEEAVGHAFDRTTMEREQNPEDPRQILWNACNAVACQIYVRRIYLEDVLAQKAEAGLADAGAGPVDAGAGSEEAASDGGEGNG